MTTTRTDYPFKAWMLTPSFKPAELTIEGLRIYYNSEKWYVSDSGKEFHRDSLFDTKAACIVEGERRLSEQQARLTKQQSTLDKRRATLEKAK